MQFLEIKHLGKSRPFCYVSSISRLQTWFRISTPAAGIGSVDEAQWLLSMVEKKAMVGLTGNPWIMPPEAVVEKGLHAVKTYYTDVREAGTKAIPRRLLKVVLVGSSSAGKTRQERYSFVFTIGGKICNNTPMSRYMKSMFAKILCLVNCLHCL